MIRAPRAQAPGALGGPTMRTPWYGAPLDPHEAGALLLILLSILAGVLL